MYKVRKADKGCKALKELKVQHHLAHKAFKVLKDQLIQLQVIKVLLEPKVRPAPKVLRALAAQPERRALAAYQGCKVPKVLSARKVYRVHKEHKEQLEHLAFREQQELQVQQVLKDLPV